MIACLAQVGGMVEDAGEDFTDDDSRIRPKYREFAERKLASYRAPEGRTPGVVALK